MDLWKMQNINHGVKNTFSYLFEMRSNVILSVEKPLIKNRVNYLQRMKYRDLFENK